MFYNYEENNTWLNCPTIKEIKKIVRVDVGHSRYIKTMSVTPSTGKITATITGIDNHVNGEQLILTPSIKDKKIDWTWSGSAKMPREYIPRR